MKLKNNLLSKLRERRIDKAIAEVLENPIISEYTISVLNWIKVFNRAYRGYGYKYHVNTVLFEYRAEENSRDKWEFPESYVEMEKIFESIMASYDGIIRRVFDRTAILTDRFIYLDNGSIICRASDVVSVQEELTKFLPEAKEDTPCIGYVIQSGRGISCNRMEINKVDEDISGNYNDDVPTERLVKVLREKRSSISILHGIPGCGKTTYIRKLIADNKDLNFYWLDASLLNLITDVSFVDFLINHPNAIYIIEDCEALLRDRGEYGNSPLTSLLNISDGMLGDSLNVKFLCTFNADLQKIDPAVLRKGRLRVKYEFKELCAEKVEALATKLGVTLPEIKPMPICEIYNLEDNGAKPVSQRKRVGF